MSNDTQNPNTPYWPPYGYPYYPPMGAVPQQPQQPAEQAPQPQMPPQGWPQQPVWPGMMPGYMPMGYAMPQPMQMQMPPQPMMQPQAMPHPHHHHHHQSAPEGFDWSNQAQGMVEGMMGEQAGMLKNIISMIGADDKEFWKGAMIGAAATLLLTNDNVRGMLMQTLSGTGEMLKTGGSKVKDAVMSGAENIRDTAATSSTIFRDTVSAGKEGFQESVARNRKAAPTLDNEDSNDEQQP